MELSPAWADGGLWGIFLACFLAATILPLASEALVLAALAGPWSLFSVLVAASAGNWLGGLSTYGLGRLGDPARLANWLRMDRVAAQRWEERARRWGVWYALLCWLPFVGDLIAAALGLVRAPLLPTALLMLVGKAARYAILLWLAEGALA